MLRTNGNGGDLRVDVQHAVIVHIHQVVAFALLIVTEEVDCTDILGWGRCLVMEEEKERQKWSDLSPKIPLLPTSA